MDHEGFEALVLEKMLGLAKDLHTVLPTEDGEVSLLKIASCIQAQQTLQHDRVLVACSASSAEPEVHEDEELAAACSLHQRRGDHRGDGNQRQDDRRRETTDGTAPWGVASFVLRGGLLMYWDGGLRCYAIHPGVAGK
ncbi:unnamed protein product [Lampetra planeri]